MEIPRAAWDILSELLGMLEGQQDRHVITVDLDQRTTQGIDMNGVMLVPIRDDDSDSIINAGRLVDFLVQAGEEAFRAGYKAGADRGCDYHDTNGVDEAWDKYTPSDAIQELQDNL